MRSVPTELQRSSGFTNFADLISLQSGTVGADVLGRTFPRGTVFDPATTRQLQAGQVDPVTGIVAARAGFVRDAFPGNQVPANRINANALKLMQLYPAPNQPGLNNNYVVNRTNTDDTHAFDLRVDHNFSANDRFFARYSFSDNHKIQTAAVRGRWRRRWFRRRRRESPRQRLRGEPHAMCCRRRCQRGTVRPEPRAHRQAAAERRRHERPARDATGSLACRSWRGNGGLPSIRPGTENATGSLSTLGHAGWVVSERFSNTAQFSDNLTKVYKSHAFKGGYIFQHIFFGSTQPPYARGEYNWNGQYTSLVNQLDNSTGRVQLLLNQIPSLVPGGVDFLGGQNDIFASPFGSVDAFKTYHGAYAQDAWHVSSKLTVNYGLRWDWFSREQEKQGEQANMVPGPPAQYLIPAEWKRQAAVAQLRRATWRRTASQLVYTDEFGSGLGKMPKNNFAPRIDAAYQLGEKYVLRSGYGLYYGAFENRGGNPSLGYNYPFQFTLRYQSPNDTTPNRLGDGSLVGLDARERIALDPTNVNANGLTLRGVEFDYKTPQVSQLQPDVADRRAAESLRRGRLRRDAGDATSRPSPA